MRFFSANASACVAATVLAAFPFTAVVSDAVAPTNSVERARDIQPVIIDYFYEASCPDCVKVRNEVLPKLEEQFEQFYTLNKYDVGIESNVVRLIAYQEKLGIGKNEPVCMVVDYRHVLNGFNVIRDRLLEQVDGGITARMGAGWTAPSPIPVEPGRQAGLETARRRARAFTVSAVAGAGLTDGINPCAIGTLVFFMSLLSVSGVRGRKLLLVGALFCAASFVTYAAIGFGLLHVLHAFSGFPKVRHDIEITMTGLLGIMAFLSFRDAIRYRMSGNANDVTLQLPKPVKMKIHDIMRTGLKSGNLVTGSLLIGAFVTALESVCTGQVYLPTLVMVTKAGAGGLRVPGYLLLYNVMFIVPLAVVFTLTYLGLRTDTLLEWSKRNVVASKVCMGCLFLLLAVLMCAF